MRRTPWRRPLGGPPRQQGAPALAPPVQTNILAAIAQAATAAFTGLIGIRGALAAAAQSATGAFAGTVTSGAFEPTDIAGCKLWLDMLDPTSFTESGGLVTAITNKVSSVSWTEATNPPAYNATGVNGHPAMDFNGTSHRLTSTEAAVVALMTDAAAFTVFIVGNKDAADRTESMFGAANSGFQTNRTRILGASNTLTGRYLSQTTNDAGTTVTVTSTAASDAAVHVFGWSSPGTTVSLSLDDAAADPSGAAHNPGTLTPNLICIGARVDSIPDIFFDGKQGEIVAYDTDLSSGDKTQVFNYLATKWA